MQDRTARIDVSTTSSATLPAITFHGVGLQIGTTEILRDVSLSLTMGAPTLLMGPNGSGKTTLLRLAMGLLEPSSGSITPGGRTNGAVQRRAIAFQRPVMLRRSVAANVAFALGAAARPADATSITRLLERVGLSGVADRPARRLSAGEQQRLGLARALAREPEVLFLDEPTASLDPAQTKAVEDIITGVAASGIKVVMATHDIGEARRLAGDVVFLVAGRVVEHAPARTFFHAPRTEAARRFLAGDLVF
jgi:tungstate transport system ATP-binding protein